MVALNTVRSFLLCAVAGCALGCGAATTSTAEANPESTEPAANDEHAAAHDDGATEITPEALFAQVQLELIDTDVAEAPLYHRGKFVLVPGLVYGSDSFVPLILDTAAPNILAPPLVPRDERAMEVGVSPLVDARGTESSVPVHVLSVLAVGEQAMFVQPATMEWWFEDETPGRCVGAGGIAGYSVTREGAWQVDLAADALRIARSLEELPLEGYRSFPLTAIDEYGATGVVVQVAGREITALLDTGYAGDLVLDRETFADLFPDAETRADGTVTAFGRPSVEETPYATAEVRLGGADGVALTVEVTGGDRQPMLGIRALRALRGFAWDRSAGRVSFGPTTRSSSVEPPRPVSARWEGGRAIVAIVRPAAQDAGVREGDVLLSADGVDLRGGGFEAYCEFLFAEEPPRRFTVERDGAEQTVEIAPH